MNQSNLTRFDTYRPPQLTEVAVVEFEGELDDAYRYAHFTSTQGAEIDLTGAAMTGKTGREKDAFNLNDVNEPLVGFLCKDNDDQSFMLAVGGPGEKDAVYREGRDKQGAPIRDVQKLEGFYDELTSRPLTIGSRPARFGGGLRLVGVLARPGVSTDVLKGSVEGPSNKKPNPLIAAGAYLLDYSKTHSE